MPLSKYAICGSKNSRFIKEQQARILSSLGLYIRFHYWVIFCFKCNSIEVYKMNNVVNKFLLAGDKLMPETHLKYLGFTYSACGPFTKKKKEFKNLKKQVIQIIFAEMN